MLSKTLSRTSHLIKASQTRSIGSVISGPPRVRVSFAEKVAHGLIMSAGLLTIPVWVLVHIREYRGDK